MESKIKLTEMTSDKVKLCIKFLTASEIPSLFTVHQIPEVNVNPIVGIIPTVTFWDDLVKTCQRPENKIKHLMFIANSVSYSNVNVKALCRILGDEYNKIEELSFDKINFTDNNFLELMRYSSGQLFGRVQKVELINTFLNNKMMTYLGSALLHDFSEIRNLNLRGCRIDADAFDTFVHYVANPDNFLTHLNISGTGLQNNGCDMLSRYFRRRQSKLVYLDITDNPQLSSETKLSLAQAISFRDKEDICDFNHLKMDSIGVNETSLYKRILKTPWTQLCQIGTNKFYFRNPEQRTLEELLNIKHHQNNLLAIISGNQINRLSVRNNNKKLPKELFRLLKSFLY